MKAFSEMKKRTGIMLAAVLLVAVVPMAAQAATDAYKKHPGFVDGLPFSEMADPEGELVEVNLTGKLLRLLSSRAIRRHDENLANILGELVSIQAVIADIDPRRVEDARKRVGEIQRKLQEREWERFVRVREGDEEFTAYVHIADDDGEDVIDGLLVIGFMDKRELLFVNLVGRIDMERIAVLGERLGVPVLGDIAAIEEDERKKKEGQSPGEDKAGGKAEAEAQDEAADPHRHAHSLY
jgi:hypothetical protein